MKKVIITLAMAVTMTTALIGCSDETDNVTTAPVNATENAATQGAQSESVATNDPASNSGESTQFDLAAFRKTNAGFYYDKEAYDTKEFLYFYILRPDGTGVAHVDEVSEITWDASNITNADFDDEKIGCAIGGGKIVTKGKKSLTYVKPTDRSIIPKKWIEYFNTGELPEDIN